MARLRSAMRLWPLLGLLLVLGHATAQTQAPSPVRVVVIGGLVGSGFWQRLAPRLEAATGTALVLVGSGNKEAIVPLFTEGQADLMLIHGSDEVMALLADGQAGRVTAWGANEHVIVGPADDPAGVRQAQNGSEAVQKIAASGAPFVAFDDPGSHAIVQKLWRIAGTRPPAGGWRLPDEAVRAQQIIEFAAQRNAYVVTGHIPVAYGKMQAPGMAVLLKGDPAMRRPYVLVEQPGNPTDAANTATTRVVGYLASPAGQADVAEAGFDRGEAWIFPVRPPRAAKAHGG